MNKSNLQEQATNYHEICILNSFLQMIIEQYWIETKHRSVNFSGFVLPYLANELSEYPNLHQYFINLEINDVKKLKKEKIKTETAQIAELSKLNSKDKLEFIKIIFQKLAIVFDNELKGDFNSMSLYRSFDGLDNILGIDYKSNEHLNITKADIDQTERLYIGSGDKVQTSYATIFNVLKYINPKYGAKLIDLGSGHGRLGFITGILRPDIQFIGYEYVKERVNVANQICENMNINNSVKFITQDLSKISFKIPLADIYYLYDPFCDDTYKKVMNELAEIGKGQKISVITKGNAGLWQKEICKKYNWPDPIEHEQGNLCFFSSNTL